MKKILLLFFAGISFGSTQAKLSEGSPETGLVAKLSSFIGYSPASFTTGMGIRFNDAEPNNTRATASLVSVDAIVTGTISSSTDVDYYKFRAPSQQLYISLYNLPANYDIRLYNGAGTLLATSQNSGTTDETLLYYPAMQGVYYFLQVYGYNGANSTESYELYVYPQ